MTTIMSNARSSQSVTEVKKQVNSRSLKAQIDEISERVKEYFSDSKAILITNKKMLHEYVDRIIESGIAAIDTETTGLDRISDHIVGSSLYFPGGYEAYIPNKHIMPLFNTPYSDQLTYEDVQEEYQRIADANVKLIFANVDFDLAMIFKDFKVDFIKNVFYDVIIAWRCLKENEKDNALKVLFNKYVMKGKGDPKKFRDFFSPDQFPYCSPAVAKLYAANDAKITFDLAMWQIPFIQQNNEKCQKNHLESISKLIWGVEFPMIEVCQNMHRRGIYLEKSVADILRQRYNSVLDAENKKMSDMVDDILNDSRYQAPTRAPFPNGASFNPNSTPHVSWLIYDLMKLGDGNTSGTGKEILSTFNEPITKQILKVRSLVTLIGTFVDKLPNEVWNDNRIHCRFNQIGADTGRMSSSNPKTRILGL